MHVVVAHYREALDWLKEIENLPTISSVVLYHKCYLLHPTAGAGANANTNTITHVSLPNVGREGHTYYHHIVENYDSLPEFTAFVQAFPFDHSPSLFSGLTRPPQQPFTWLSEQLIDYTFSQGCRHHPGLPLREVYRYLFDAEPPTHPVVFGAGAQFIVSKDRIRQRPKAFYQRIVDLLGRSVNPIEGFVIERLHPLIFASTS